MVFFRKKKKAVNTEGTERAGITESTGNTETRRYISGAGGSIVSRSILSGASRLKWIFRQESPYGNGWIAFGDTDTEEYVNNPENMAVVDFNTLANIEPAVLDIFYMPVGADLEFCSDQDGTYFIDTRTGEEIREPVKHPAQIAFEKNLKFMNKETYPLGFFRSLFQKDDKITAIVVGEADFPTGEIVLADPLAYLGSEYETRLDQTIPPGSYPVELSICNSPIAGLRIAAARLRIGGCPSARYEIAMPKGSAVEDFGKPRVWTFFGVDTGLACITDVSMAGEYRDFFTKWQKDHPDKNKYDDYFKELFQKSYEAHPEVQKTGGDFLLWQIPASGHKLVMFSSGMGDGIYSGYWGMDEDGNITELIIPFMNPAYF